MDMTKEQPQPSGTGQTSSPDKPTPGVGKVDIRESLGRRGFFAGILSRLKGEDSPRQQDTDHNQGVNNQVSDSGRREDFKRSDSPLSLNRRQFTAAAGAAAGLFAIDPEKALAQLGGVGPDGAPPPDVSDPNTPLPDNRSPEAREAREAYLLPIEFLHDYKGKDANVEEAARETFKTLFGITSEVSRAVPALQRLNEYMTNQDDPNKNIKDGYHLVQGLGPGNQYGEVSVGVIAFNPGVDMDIPGVSPNRPLSIIRRIQTYKHPNPKTNQTEEKILLEFVLVIGVPNRDLMNPDNIGLVVENVLHPHNLMVAEKRGLEGMIREMLSRDGIVDVEQLRNDLKDRNSDFSTNARIQAWEATLEPLDDILSSGTWRVDPDFAKFHDGYKALRPQEGDPPDTRDKKLKEMRDYLGRRPN